MKPEIAEQQDHADGEKDNAADRDAAPAVPHHFVPAGAPRLTLGTALVAPIAGGTGGGRVGN
jgi:hypothetical protein